MEPTQRGSRGFEDVPGKGSCGPDGEGGMEGDCAANAQLHCLRGTNSPFFKGGGEGVEVVIKNQEKQRGLLGVSEKKKKKK